MLSPMVRRSKSSSDTTSWLASTFSGISGCRRAKARRRWVSAAARFADVIAASI